MATMPTSLVRGLMIALLILGLPIIINCSSSNSVPVPSDFNSAVSDDAVIQQSGTMYADQIWDIPITTGISGGTYTYSFLPEFVTADDQSATTGVVHADPKGATGTFPFVIEVSNGTDSEMIRYTLTVISK